MKISDTHSGTFGCSKTQVTSSYAKEPSFRLLTKDRVNIN